MPARMAVTADKVTSWLFPGHVVILPHMPTCMLRSGFDQMVCNHDTAAVPFALEIFELPAYESSGPSGLHYEHCCTE